MRGGRSIARRGPGGQLLPGPRAEPQDRSSSLHELSLAPIAGSRSKMAPSHSRADRRYWRHGSVRAAARTRSAARSRARGGECVSRLVADAAGRCRGWGDLEVVQAHVDGEGTESASRSGSQRSVRSRSPPRISGRWPPSLSPPGRSGCRAPASVAARAERVPAGAAAGLAATQGVEHREVACAAG